MLYVILILETLIQEFSRVEQIQETIQETQD